MPGTLGTELEASSEEMIGEAGRPRRAGRPKLLTGRRSAVAQVLEDAASGVYTFNVD